MKKRTKIIISSAIVLSLTGGAVAYAKHGQPGQYMKQHISESLSLTEEQSTQLESLMTTMKTSKKEFRSSGVFDFSKMIALLESQNLDQEKAMELVREKLANVESQAQTIIASTATFTDSLNDEQRKQLTEMINERSKRHHKRHNGHNKGHGNGYGKKHWDDKDHDYGHDKKKYAE